MSASGIVCSGIINIMGPSIFNSGMGLTDDSVMEMLLSILPAAWVSSQRVGVD